MGVGENTGENSGENTGSGGRVSSPSTGDPTVDLPNGLNEGESFTINGSGFGSQLPNNLVFELFNGNGASVGDALNATNTQFNTFTASSGGNQPPRFSTDRIRGGNFSADTYFVGDFSKFGLNVPGRFDSVMWTYAIQIPSGKSYPGTSTPGAFPTYSAFKHSWVMEDTLGQSDDVVDCTWTSTKHQTLGNDAFRSGDFTNERVLGTGPDTFSFGVWNRRCVIFKQQGTPGVDPVAMYWHNVSPGGIQIKNWLPTAKQFYEDSATGYAGQGWQQLNFPGWATAHSSTSGNGQVLYADVTIDVGVNAGARVELGNNSTYTSCTDLAMCQLSTWNNTAISGTIRKGGFNLPGPSGTLWWFVHDADNELLWSGAAN